MYYIGIDLGTSGLKGLLVDENGNILREESASYPVYYPQEGWSEQNPEDWLNAAQKVLSALTKGLEEQIAGLSVAGQMHGLVILDENNEVIRPAILWNDGRTDRQTDYLNTVIGKEKLSRLTANIAFAGFTAPKILWVKECEPRNYARISKIMLPKDYLTFKLTGVFSTDYSDASGTLLLDVKNKKWSAEMLEICSVKREWLPALYESYEVVGKILPEYNLPNCVVTAGAGDNAAAAIGTGTVEDGSCNISLGTSGTVFVCQDDFSVDKNNALHSFAHAGGKWHLMGCILSAASCNKWWLEDVLQTSDYTATQNAALGENSVFFLPYLMGERSPHNDVNARGAFIGMSAGTTRQDMSLAVLEGVAFALRDCVEIARQNGLKITRTNLCGGGAKSQIWQKIIANAIGVQVYMTETEQGPALGAAILAMVGSKRYDTISKACNAIVKSNLIVAPCDELVEKYNDKYQRFKKLYPALKSFF